MTQRHFSTSLTEDEAARVHAYLANIDRTPAWWLRQIIRAELTRLEWMARLPHEARKWHDRMAAEDAERYVSQQLARARQWEEGAGNEAM